MENNDKNVDNFRLLFEQAPLEYQSLDIDGNFIEVNQQWCDTLGYDRNEVIGKWFGDFLTPIYQNGFRERFPVFKAQGHIHSEFEMLHKNGSVLFVAFEGRIGFDSTGHFKQTHCILKDITEQKKNEISLKYALDLLKSAGRLAKFGGWSVILSENRSYWSDEVAAIHEMPPGYSPLLQDGINFYAPEWRDKITQVFTDCAQKGIPYDEEMEIITSSGRRVWVRTNGEAVRDEKGMIYKVQGGFQDITQRKLNEEKLSETTMRLRSVFDQSPVGSVIVGLDKRFQKCNASFCRFIGYSEDELIGRTIAEITHPEDVNLGMNELKLMAEGKIEMATVEKRYVRKDGSVVWGEISISLARNADNKPLYFLPVILDITKRKQAESGLSDLIENNPMSIQIMDIEGFTLQVNNAHFLLFGAVPPSDFSIFEDLQNKGFGKYILLAKNGEIVHFPDIYYNAHDALPELPDKPVWVRAILFSLKDASGRIEKFVFMHEDITKNKLAELAIKQRIDELENFQRLVVGRELKMIELKKEINELLKKCGSEPKY